MSRPILRLPNRAAPAPEHPPMSADELAEALADIGWTVRQMSMILDMPQRTAHRMQAGEKPVPENVAVWLRRLAAVHRQHALPQGWHDAEQVRPGGADDDGQSEAMRIALADLL